MSFRRNQHQARCVAVHPTALGPRFPNRGGSFSSLYGPSCGFSCSGVMAARQREIRLPAKAKACDVAQTPLCVYRHFTGAVCTTSSDGRFAAFSLESRLSDPSDMVRSRTSRSRRLLRHLNSKLFAGNYGCNRRGHLGARHVLGRHMERLEPNARPCVAVAQVVKVKASCVAIEVKRQKTSTSSQTKPQFFSPAFCSLAAPTRDRPSGLSSSLSRRRTSRC